MIVDPAAHSAYFKPQLTLVFLDVSSRHVLSEVSDQWTDIRVQGSAYYTHPSSFIPHPFLKSLWNQRPRQKPAAALISRLGPGCFLVVSSVLSITSPMVVSRTDWIFSAA